MASDRIYVRGFPSDFSVEDLKRRFKEFGRVRRCHMKKSEDGRVCGFVRYYSSESAEDALSLNGATEGEISWTVAKALHKRERTRKAISDYQRICSERKGRNLVILNLPEMTKTSDLQQLFSSFGTIKNAGVKERNEKIYGFVEFETIESANQAIQEMKGYHVGGNQISVQKHTPKFVLGLHIKQIKQFRANRKAGYQMGRFYARNMVRQEYIGEYSEYSDDSDDSVQRVERTESESED